MKPEQVAGVILAGGKSSRMGTDKAGMMINQRETLLEHAVGIFNTIFNENLIIANRSYPVDIPVYPDLYPGMGPAGGIYTALTRTAKKGVMAVACDMPNLGYSAIAYIIRMSEDKRISVPVVKGRLEPLAAYYPAEIKGRLETYLKSGGRALHQFIMETGYTEIEMPEKFRENFININTPQEFDDYKTREVI